MRSRDEFVSDEKFDVYLRQYYSGLIMAQIAARQSENIQSVQQENAKEAAQTTSIYVDEMMKVLFPFEPEKR